MEPLVTLTVSSNLPGNKSQNLETFIDNTNVIVSLNNHHKTIAISQSQAAEAAKFNGIGEIAVKSQAEVKFDGPRSVSILSKQNFFRGDIRGKAAWSRRVSRGKLNLIGLIIQHVLASAFQEYHTRTCIRFTPRIVFDYDYLYIGKIDGCYSDVGRAGGRQEVSLDNGCLQYSTAIHELMHAIGFFHEHERWDRDNFIAILWSNIDQGERTYENNFAMVQASVLWKRQCTLSGAYDQFSKVDLTDSSYYGQPYDYYSIMHYDSLAFSKNGHETLIARSPGMTSIMGSAVDFSASDVAKINAMYSCSTAATKRTYFYNNYVFPQTNRLINVFRHHLSKLSKSLSSILTVPFNSPKDDTLLILPNESQKK
ncbi:unnamed protein product [Anisakis simplex]|uniref:Metalloendopeptidase n=1 Tax=Anisakis simplex TaxID=6269 RepID=A0A0M3JS64_ANISI|nr:unnamed protein product [Anisakis simplex]